MRSSKPELGCRIPQELSDLIIDHLYDDTDALRQCSLVCKSWEPSSTLHLFSSFSWPACNIYWQSVPKDGSEVCTCSRHSGSFSECHDLFSSSSRISQAIRHFRLTGLRYPDGNMSKKAETEPMPLTLLFSLPQLLSSLHTLQIWNLVRGQALVGALPQIPSPCKLRKLELASDVVLFDDKAVFTILSAFHHINTVDLSCSCEEDLDSSPIQFQVLHHLDTTLVEHLEISWPMGVSHILSRLPEQIDMDKLRRITVHQHLDESLEALLRSARALEALAYMPTDTPPPIPCPVSLRVIEVTCHVVVDDPKAPVFAESAWSEDAALRDLSVLEAPDLRELSIVILLSELGYWGEGESASEDMFAHAFATYLLDQDWESLRGILRRRRKLQKLKLGVIVSDGWSSYRYLVPYLPCCGRVIQEVASKSLGAEMTSILEVEAKHQTSDGFIPYYP